jgi:hypothetical protein
MKLKPETENTAAFSAAQHLKLLVKKTCIPLEILFDYPTNTDLPQASDSEGMY